MPADLVCGRRMTRELRSHAVLDPFIERCTGTPVHFRARKPIREMAEIMT
jgi:hypothetical protein